MLTQRLSINPSIRAYRMKLDGWGVQKNASAPTRKKRRIEISPDPKSNSDAHEYEASRPPDVMVGSTQPSTESSMNLKSSNDRNSSSDFDAHLMASLQEHPFTLPNGRLKADELVKCLPWHLREHRLLIVLLLNWQADGTYLKLALQKMGKTDPVWLWSKSLFRGNIFKIIDEKLDAHERGRLTKAFLCHIFQNLSTPKVIWQWWEWMLVLMNIANSQSWTQRKSFFEHADLSREVMGQSFVYCVPVVAAEHLLFSLKSKLQEMIEPGNPNFDASGISNLRGDYLEIMNDFKDAKSGLGLDPAYYKFAMCLARWYEERQTKKIQKISDECKAVQRRLALLKEQHSILQQRLSESMDGSNQSASMRSDAAPYGENKPRQRPT
jgi:hypothetical protein